MTSGQTHIESEHLRTIADAIGAIAQDTSAFTKLQSQHPSAGNFDAAKWLTDVVADRRNALYQHGMDLKQTFHEMSVRLHDIADEYDRADTGNAAGVAKLEAEVSEDLSVLQSHVVQDVADPVQGPEAGTDYTSDDHAHPDGHDSTVTLHDGGTATVTNAEGDHHDVQSTHDTPNPDVDPTLYRTS